MTDAQHIEILKSLPKGEIVHLIKSERYSGARLYEKSVVKISDHGEFMIVLWHGFKMPIVYKNLWHERLDMIEKITEKLSK